MSVNNTNRWRIELPPNYDAPDYSMFGADPNLQRSFTSDALKGNLQKNGVSVLFFSQMNIDILQTGIKNMVLNKTCGKQRVGTQSEQELMTIMRSIYLQNGKNSVDNVIQQVKILNENVLEYSVPRVLDGLAMQTSYIDRITTLQQPLDKPISASSYGTKSQEFKPRF
jgi:uncharacterized protein YnzC (UPF0291/DUF896 family)